MPRAAVLMQVAKIKEQQARIREEEEARRRAEEEAERLEEERVRRLEEEVSFVFVCLLILNLFLFVFWKGVLGEGRQVVDVEFFFWNGGGGGVMLIDVVIVGSFFWFL